MEEAGLWKFVSMSFCNGAVVYGDGLDEAIKEVENKLKVHDTFKIRCLDLSIWLQAKEDVYGTAR
ncbi:hypothetical protein CI610_01755 [invertebrate metagenome]|uniref:Uncharacterized protein n=1 Tax=invertebrate metagenome TaxID=1711999 RepID=A0A2H9T7T6_9ZZZZ